MTTNNQNIGVQATKNIFSENIYDAWQIDEKQYMDCAKSILNFYLSIPEVY